MYFLKRSAMGAFAAPDLGKLLLRILVGGLMLFHGFAKVTYGIDFVKASVVRSGLPEFLAYGVYLGEIVAPIMLILGLKTRAASVVLAFTMLIAIYTVHLGHIFALNKHGAWVIELPVFYLGTALAILFLGAGKYSVDKS